MKKRVAGFPHLVAFGSFKPSGNSQIGVMSAKPGKRGILQEKFPSKYFEENYLGQFLLLVKDVYGSRTSPNIGRCSDKRTS
jgi:hypothetical protein